MKPVTGVGEGGHVSIDDIPNVAAHRVLDRLEEAVDLGRVSLGHHLDPPIGQVTDVAGHVEPSGEVAAR